MLTVHHLQRSQSERIVWLCEELALPYTLKTYKRDSKTFAAPPELASLHSIGTAPVVQDNGITIAESGAVVEYIVAKHAPGTELVVRPEAPNYADYLYWLHFANGTLQPTLVRLALVKNCGISQKHRGAVFTMRNYEKSFRLVDERLRKSKWLAGDEFTLADVMTVTTFTTMRLFCPLSLEGRDGILRWLKDVGERPAYRKAMEKGDPGFEPLLGAEEPERISAEKL